MSNLIPGRPGKPNVVPGVDSLRVSWAWGSSFIRFEVAYARDDQWPNGIQRAYTQYLNHNITGLQPETKYYIELRVETVDGQSEPAQGSGSTRAGAATPATPTGLTAAATKSSVVLTWYKSILAAGYKVSYGFVSNGSIINTIPTSAETCNVSGLQSGTAYFFDVVAYNAAGDSPPVRTTATTLLVPAAPTGLSATSTMQSMDLMWTASAGANNYVIRYGIEPGGAAQAQTSTAPGLTLTGLSKNTQYFIQVSAANGNGESSPTRIVKATLEGPALPSRPGALHITATHATARINWGTPQSPQYKVSYGLDNAEHKVIRTETTPHLNFLFADLLPSTRYFFEVRGTHSGGDSEPSVGTATTAVFAAPRDLVIGELTDESVVWQWSAGEGYSGEIHYEIYLGDQHRQTISGTRYVVQGLIENTQYLFKVRARGGAGYVSGFASGSFTTRPYLGQMICAPGYMRGTRSTATAALLTWDEPYATCSLCPNAQGYEISGAGIKTFEVVRPPCEVTGLNAALEYHLKVRAKGGGNNVSAASSVFISREPAAK